ncbi:MAG TPA: ATP-binding protein [Anaerohalosphaeraceae bacterium]|nr:ATP-binding protein [Anaerohalosphaeraceae bacterium]HOL31106.1 ATP-binding protein [Anaerohalosphaeraceae bacterium]HPC63879.1 ATP-binding protein [Anaerohalosphaeraceae bacterium]HPO68720.1 ATP-binding protein [Anaerohalosphaeraceae bacterium]HRS70536.1 ATP-binding protein [Anaerohalosphaeraceae bacterium]
MHNHSLLQFDALCKMIAEPLHLGLISFDPLLNIIDYTPSVAKFVYLEPTVDLALLRGTDTNIWKDWKSLLLSSLHTGQKADFGTVKYMHEGQVRLLNLSCLPVRNSDAADLLGGVLAFHDTTEKSDIEHGLAQAERLIAIGKVTGKVAHELNNPLDGILRYVNLSMRIIEQGQPQKAMEYLQHCRTGLQRMTQVITELLEFSRSTHLAFETSPVDKLLEDALRAMEGLLRNVEVKIQREYTAPLPHLKSDSLFQVFCNLIKNAADAMEGRGQLTITIRQTSSEWQIEFRDTGPGIDPKHMDDIFKPFFTTKPQGKGTGLGLAICKDILAKLDGRITAQNAPQGGGLFTVYLPLHNPNRS